MDFKEKMIVAAKDKKDNMVGGENVANLQKALIALDIEHVQAAQDKQRESQGLKPIKKFSVADTIARLKQKEEADDEPVIDPYTVKIRRFPNEITEDDLRESLSEFGEVVRCKIPMDLEYNCNKGIGFITSRSKEDCSAALAHGVCKFDMFEYKIE